MECCCEQLEKVVVLLKCLLAFTGVGLVVLGFVHDAVRSKK